VESSELRQDGLSYFKFINIYNWGEMPFISLTDLLEQKLQKLQKAAEAENYKLVKKKKFPPPEVCFAPSIQLLRIFTSGASAGMMLVLIY